ncbi:LysR family transcriptional regulator ArgP [Undibacterium sp. RuTC16W]|uniref:LysR family transcriptional regulator ArgP n=1 Tax=Undibacterium sp. RuTC16W TaxID=3413048 RepID=UPI003BF3C0FB
MKFDTRQCAALMSVIDSGSFEAAAQQLSLTPSALSQRIRALEIQLGSTLVIRSRPCRATPAGQRLLQHLRRVAEMEQDLSGMFADLPHAPVSIALAVNADSLDSWVLPALGDFLIKENILLDLCIDDQEHTHDLLENGMVLGCISAEPQAMRGCEAEALGNMRYQAVASKAFCTRWFPQGMQRESARLAPVLTFNRKDKLQSQFLLEHFGLTENVCPRHHIPATAPYNRAIVLGLGWGMIPELMLKEMQAEPELIRLAPDRPVDVALYWHHWKVQSPRLARLSAKLVESARSALLSEA